MVAAIRVAVYYVTSPPRTKYGEVRIDEKIPPEEDVVAKIKELYDLDVKPNREKSVKIHEIYLYPVRGIKGVKVDHVETTPFGLKQDRNWVIIGVRKMKPFANHNSEIITFLRQSFVDEERTKLKIFLQDSKCFPDLEKRVHILDFKRKYTEAEFVECKENYRGYKESEELNKWLSQIFDEEVFIMRAQSDRVMPVNQALPDKLQTDKRGAFVTDAAIHVLNK